MIPFKNRIKKLESEVCPEDTNYTPLILGYRANPQDKNLYMKDKKIIGRIPAICERTSAGKAIRMISSTSGIGENILKKLGYQKIT